ncbi:thiosulfate/3-mercaptopyruvate sulfurtransferase [Raineyella antarctica]|uniref:Thiosulfate/3-mercaptopyruvate sulfurtransferase n=1 Tax=Raineyella antarctica TaxID=1577474 RepID=A0A1G6GQF1_9ACTN|nr:sulfurtransferase [Raineyella antarctica]SDB84073.1 thiosulfate/3-mercaptopyruvate sulfurtransferase [Raineyella antarctica]
MSGSDRSPLIPVAGLVDLLSAGTPLTLLDARFNLQGPDAHQEYLHAHLPGAVWVDVEQALCGPRGERGRGGRHPLPDSDTAVRVLRACGVRDDRPVVVYDGGSQLGAARVWWLLEDLGHRDVRVLDGGLPAWLAAGLPIMSGETRAEPGDLTGRRGRLPVVDADGVVSALAAGHAVWDVRAADRFRGEYETIDPVAGHIPGASSKPAALVFTAEGTLRNPGELAGLFADVSPGDVLSCGSGLTAMLQLLALRHAGRADGVAVYAGSWSDWISDPSRPVATGPQD